MQHTHFYSSARFLLAIGLAVLPSLCHAQTSLPESDATVYQFQASQDGGNPTGVTASSTGTLFGTTEYGGTNGFGTIFRVLPDGEEAVLYSFMNSGDGTNPSVPAMDAKGDLFGTTQPVSASNGPPGIGNSALFNPGIVWELPYTGMGSTGYGSLVVLAQLNSNTSGVTLDAKGDLFGTTQFGGKNGYGSVWELPYTGTDYGSMTDLYSFSFTGIVGYQPVGGLSIDSSGDLFGTTTHGAAGNGVIFKLANTQSGYSSTVTVLHLFAADQSEGILSNYRPLLAADGSLIGECSFGGIGDSGTVWQLAPDPASTTGYSSTLTLLYNPANYFGGSAFESRLIQNSAGDVFGAASSNGPYTHGAVFELKKQQNGSYKYTPLYAFTGSSGDGAFPFGAFGFGVHGCLYGTAFAGGTAGSGTVFRVGPRIISVSPNFLAASAAQQLTVTGTGLSANDTVYFNNTALTTSYAAGTLTASLPANLVTGSYGTVTVQDSLMDISTAGKIVLIGQGRLTASVQSTIMTSGGLEIVLQLNNTGTAAVSGIAVTGASAVHAGNTITGTVASEYNTILPAGSNETVTLNFSGYTYMGLGRLVLHISDSSGALQQVLFFYAQ